MITPENGLSVYWEQRHKNPCLIKTWKEFALAHTAWAWLDLDYTDINSTLWHKSWDNMLSTTPHVEDTQYMEQALFVWGDHVSWTPKMSTSFLFHALKIHNFKWSSVLNSENIKPRSLAYHTIFSLAAHADVISPDQVQYIWKTIVDSKKLHSGQKETLLLALCPHQGKNYEILNFNEKNHDYWFNQLCKCTNIDQWLDGWLDICKAVDIVPTREMLCEYWTHKHSTHKEKNELLSYQKVLDSINLSCD